MYNSGKQVTGHIFCAKGLNQIYDKFFFAVSDDLSVCFSYYSGKFYFTS